MHGTGDCPVAVVAALVVAAQEAELFGAFAEPHLGSVLLLLLLKLLLLLLRLCLDPGPALLRAMVGDRVTG